MPRLRSGEVFQRSIEDASGLANYFGLSQGFETGRYLNFSYKISKMLYLGSEDICLIEPKAAEEYQSVIEAQKKNKKINTSKGKDFDETVSSEPSVINNVKRPNTETENKPESIKSALGIFMASPNRFLALLSSFTVIIIPLNKL